MKKLLSLIAVLTLTLATFTACSKDDDGPQEQNLLVGTWVYSLSTSSEYSDIFEVTTKTIYVFREDMSLTFTLQIYFNGKLTTNVSGEGKYSYSSSKHTLTITDDSSKPVVYTAYLQGNKLTLISDDGTSLEFIKQ